MYTHMTEAQKRRISEAWHQMTGRSIELRKVLRARPSVDAVKQDIRARISKIEQTRNVDTINEVERHLRRARSSELPLAMRLAAVERCEQLLK